MQPKNFDNKNSITDQVLLDWMQKHFSFEKFTSGFERIKDLLQELVLKIKKRKFKIVTIAGTNGKGETAYWLEYFLQNYGVKTALWTSPHIISLTERFRFDGKNIEHRRLFDTFNILLKKTKSINEYSFYEFLFFSFLSILMEEDIDVVILEVGLGGRLDAVNILDADISIVTSISRDHEKILGLGYKKILMEKLGIARSNKLLITALELQFLRNIVKDYSKINSIIWKDLFSSKKILVDDGYRKRNKILACEIFSELINNNHLKENVQESCFAKKMMLSEQILNFKGRFEEIIKNDLTYVFSGAHNIDGLRKLHDELIVSNKYLQFDCMFVSFSERSVSEINILVKLLTKRFSNFVPVCICSFDHPRAWDYNNWMNNSDIKLRDTQNFDSINNIVGIQYIGDKWINFIDKNKSFKGRVFVTGSNYFISEIQKHLAKI